MKTTHLQSDMSAIKALLPTDLFPGSKDWNEGNIVDRIEWLLEMYAASTKEIERLTDTVEMLFNK